MKLEWSKFKTIVNEMGLYLQYGESDKEYFIKALNGTVVIAECTVSKAHEEISDFENNFKPLANKKVQDVDDQGRQINRLAYGRKGWTFQVFNIEASTSTLTQPYNKDVDGNDLGYATKKIYNSDGDEITTAGIANANLLTCVKTVIDFEPPYDYEVIGGAIRQKTTPGTDIRLWITAVPDISYANGGSKPMTQGGLNLRYIDSQNVVDLDGKTSKYMTYNATYHTNKIRVTIKHDAGVNHDLLFQVQIFKA